MGLQLEVGGTLGRIIGVVIGATVFALGAVLTFIAYYWVDGLQMWLVGIVAAVFVLYALHTVIAALTKDDYEATIGSGRVG